MRGSGAGLTSAATGEKDRDYLVVMATISTEEAKRKLQTLAGWELSGNAIRRQFTLRDFTDALAFVVRLGFAAESVDHHPDILINYKRVTLTYSTHSAGGLTDKDFAGAEEASRLAARFE
jgi:4a-hydroxytetrahydrobiopterin dehydratase